MILIPGKLYQTTCTLRFFPLENEFKPLSDMIDTTTAVNVENGSVIMFVGYGQQAMGQLKQCCFLYKSKVLSGFLHQADILTCFNPVGQQQ